MHELSLAMSIVETVTESLADYPGATVKEVRLRVGALAAVEEESLQFCFGVATEGSPVAGARLLVNRLPVILHCTPCGKDVELAGVQTFRCPVCGTQASGIRQGRELEIESIEIDEKEADARPPSGVEAAIETSSAQEAGK
jgi:hydrogenase nickel incorporation protein HypA/HybF